MRENELGPRRKKRFVLTTRSEKGQKVAENLLERNFEVSAPNRVWVSDITYVATAEGWVFLCIVLDLYSRRVVGWSMSATLSAELVVAAVAMCTAPHDQNETPTPFSAPGQPARISSEHEPPGRPLG
jgi:transposase InsO family protein